MKTVKEWAQMLAQKVPYEGTGKPRDVSETTFLLVRESGDVHAYYGLSYDKKKVFFLTDNCGETYDLDEIKHLINSLTELVTHVETSEILNEA